MKKILALILIVAAGLLVVNYEKISGLFQKKENNVLAKVNGTPITLEEVETLYDMRNVHLNSPAPDVDKVRQEYAKILYNRIKQLLVSEELKKRGVKVTAAEVDKLEATVKESYREALTEEKDFPQYLEEHGIDYAEWKKQLLSQLEIEKFQRLLLQDISLSSEETMQYAEKIKQEQSGDIASISFFMIKANGDTLKKIREDKAFSAENVEKEGFDTDKFIARYEEMGASVLESLFDMESLPEQYKKVLLEMKNNTFSDILTEDGHSYLLYLQDKKEQEKKDAVDLYLLAEEKLLYEKLPQAFDDWLTKAIEGADIYIVDSLKPENLYKEEDANKINSLQEALTEMEK